MTDTAMNIALIIFMTLTEINDNYRDLIYHRKFDISELRKTINKKYQKYHRIKLVFDTPKWIV